MNGVTHTIPVPDDMHAHLRTGPFMREVIEPTAKVFARALLMPNLVEPVTDAERLVRYRAEVMAALEEMGNRRFQPLMTIYLTDQTTPEMIIEAQKVGAVAAKLYIRGTTTNSHHGVTDLWALRPVFATMEKLGMVLCIHGEKPIGDVLDWEEAFLPDLMKLAREFPSLKIVLEHISTAAAVRCVKKLHNVAATVTPHHLVLIHNDILGYGQIKPHNFCMPVAKREADRQALIEFVTSGHPRVFCGTDTAPHLQEKKLCACGAAGIFNAPTAIAVYAHVFEKAGALHRLGTFMSESGADHYGLERNKGTITLIKKPWTVPDLINGVVPFMAGQELSWQVA